MTAEERAAALQLYIDGASLKSIGEIYDRHPGIIQRMAAKFGVQRGHKFRPKGVRHGGRQKRDGADAATGSAGTDAGSSDQSS